MNIGKLNTWYKVYERQEGKDEVGQRTTTYVEIGEVRGQHIIRNMSANMNAHRENPVVSQYAFFHYDNIIAPRNYLVDEFGAQYVINSVRRTGDRGLIQASISEVTVKQLELLSSSGVDSPYYFGTDIQGDANLVDVLAGTQVQELATGSVTVNWNTDGFLWVWIPDFIPAKTVWSDPSLVLNVGSIGGETNLFAAPVTVVVGADTGKLYITNYETTGKPLTLV